jgi:predicted hydrolases of the HAD superfamily
MKILCTDLDNTIIYSYKHDIGNEKMNVELYKEREISFISNHTYELLKKVKEEFLIIPTSTRTKEQYNRIDLKIGIFKYALVCNGSVLLVDGKKDKDWYEESLRLAKPSNLEVKKALEYLENDKRRTFELRYIEDLFVFTKCDEAETVVNELREYLDKNLVNVFNNKEKVYVLPTSLSKGKAIERLRKYLKVEFIIAAGDSEFDISMVEAADVGLVPYGFKSEFNIKSDIYEMGKEGLFSEQLLSKCLQYGGAL